MKCGFNDRRNVIDMLRSSSSTSVEYSLSMIVSVETRSNNQGGTFRRCWERRGYYIMRGHLRIRLIDR